MSIQENRKTPLLCTVLQTHKRPQRVTERRQLKAWDAHTNAETNYASEPRTRPYGRLASPSDGRSTCRKKRLGSGAGHDLVDVGRSRPACIRAVAGRFAERTRQK